MAQSRQTTDHDEIRRWVEDRDGQPAAVRETGSDGDPGILRIDLPGGAGEDALERISWEEWFEKFDNSELSFLYQEEKASGERSMSFKLVGR